MRRYFDYEVGRRRWWHRRGPRPDPDHIALKIRRTQGRDNGRALAEVALAVDAAFGPGRMDTRADGTIVYEPND